ncbi:MAG: hypothetical protein LKJ51_05555 [Limosilactobacillus sp.]|uniref:hypothetical protein n=1 Tax=Limosilactobacillus sp. TaxID=2773925 RepID=UPI0025B98ABB|nr:hypothetical protein [Limosilactobacillus sp.]MCI1975367.1 hypothetical protein [Limosilactobacillus sp.]MCI2031488.1 hypothetical protein [Limosilactobacillus sp.]
MPKDDPLTQKAAITPADLVGLPLLVSEQHLKNIVSKIGGGIPTAKLTLSVLTPWPLMRN